MNYGNYTVTFKSDGFPSVTALLDETPPQITGGHGGWQVTARARKIGLTQWQGNDPLRIAIPIVFDHAINHITDQRIAINTLGRMGLPPSGGGEPPIVYVHDKTGVVPDPTNKGSKQPWVIESLTWGTNVRHEYNPSAPGIALRQDVIVNLLEYVDEDRVAFANLPSISKHRGKKHKDPTKPKTNPPDSGRTHGPNTHGWPKWYTSKPGDTLPSIAAHFYHDSSAWHRIANANKIRDPRALKPFTLLIIPAP